MEENTKNTRNDDQINSDQDQLRNKTTSEVIREVHGDPDMNLNDIRDTNTEISGNHETGSGGSHDSDLTQGMSWNPNDASAVRSGGTTDMDDQTSGGAGLNTGPRRGLGSHMKTKMGTTGSDFDGQNASS